eukprot:768817-Hanusia_phi.AAC.8
MSPDCDVADLPLMGPELLECRGCERSVVVGCGEAGQSNGGALQHTCAGEGSAFAWDGWRGTCVFDMEGWVGGDSFVVGLADLSRGGVVEGHGKGDGLVNGGW